MATTMCYSALGFFTAIVVNTSVVPSSAILVHRVDFYMAFR